MRLVLTVFLMTLSTLTFSNEMFDSAMKDHISTEIHKAITSGTQTKEIAIPNQNLKDYVTYYSLKGYNISVTDSGSTLVFNLTNAITKYKEMRSNQRWWILFLYLLPMIITLLYRSKLKSEGNEDSDMFLVSSFIPGVNFIL